MSKIILIVDDAPTMRQMISYTLASGGYQVIEACDGKDGLSKLNGRKIDGIITDLNMPNMDGIAFIKAVRSSAQARFLPVIMLTTESQEAKKKEGQVAGATGWIVKPFTPEQLLKTLERVLPK